MVGRKSSLWTVGLVMCCLAAMPAVNAVADSHKEAAEKSEKMAKKDKAADKAVDKAMKEKAEVTSEMKTDAAQNAMMADMMKNAAPGPQHAWLKQSEGTWKATVKTWMGPGEPMVSEGSSENHMILGGRYLEQRFKGSMMGMPFEGYGLTGYDNQKKVFTSFWIDNSSTAMMSSTGTTDETGKMLTMTSEVPGMDGKPMQSKTVLKVVDDKTCVYSMYGNMGGKEMLMMEITYNKM